MALIYHPKGFRDALVSVARGELGVREVGNNGGKRVREYQSATWLAQGPWSWCAAFVCWCYLTAAREHFPAALSQRPTTPRAYGFETWGRVNARVFKDSRRILPGDFVIFNFSHIGIAIDSPSLGSIETIDGNTSADNAGNDGDGVLVRRRSLSLVRSFVRLPEHSAFPWKNP